MKLMSFATIAGAIGVGGVIALSSIYKAPVAPPPVVSIEVEEYDPTWKLPSGSPAEQYVLEQLQKHTKIRDRNALAAIMGNIKQESNFHPNICEGGRIPYDACRSGGYGLIQWTSINRYNNLGKFCEKYGCDPSSLEGQTRYMINESNFQRGFLSLKVVGTQCHSIWFHLSIGWDGASKEIEKPMHTIILRNWY